MYQKYQLYTICLNSIVGVDNIVLRANFQIYTVHSRMPDVVYYCTILQSLLQREIVGIIIVYCSAPLL